MLGSPIPSYPKQNTLPATRCPRQTIHGGWVRAGGTAELKKYAVVIHCCSITWDWRAADSESFCKVAGFVSIDAAEAYERISLWVWLEPTAQLID